MLKKKNMAIMMAVATAATTVAPAFADMVEETTTDAAKLLSEVERLLSVKYTDSKETGIDGVRVSLGNEYQNSVYKITVGNTEIKDTAQLRRLIEKADIDGSKIVVKIVDKGHKEVNGQIVATENNQFKKYDATELAKVTKVELDKVCPGIVTDVDVAKLATEGKVILTLANDDEITLTEDNYQVDFSKPVDKNGNIVSKEATGSIAKKVVGFKEITTGNVVENGIPSTDLAEITYTSKLTKIEKNITAYKTDDGYTKDGEEFVNLLVDANVDGAGADAGFEHDANKDGKKYTSNIVKNGKLYDITFNKANDITDVKIVDEGGYKFTVTLLAKEEDAVAPTELEVVVKGNSEKELNELRTAMIGNTKVSEGHGGKTYTSLTGDDRFETAVKISEAARPGVGSSDAAPADLADAVILVGKDAVVDGLAAAPLSTQKDAPILLSDKDSVNKDTLDEMKRVLTTTKSNRVVYIVGGENTISKKVEAQLSKELECKIVRISGQDRFATSTEIAKELTMDTTGNADEAFIVGGDGLADAMSIAAVASQKTKTIATPIIVTPKDGLTVEAKHFLDKNEIEKTTVVGGSTKVSKVVLDELKDIVKDRANSEVIRVAGNDRHDTNVKVINKYYRDTTVENIFVAQDGYVGGDSKLIDALAVASYAGDQDAPIVLATSDLTKDQADAITAKKAASPHQPTKVGGGVATSVMERIIDLLGL